MRRKRSKRANITLAVTVAEFTWARWFLEEQSTQKTMIEADKAEYFHVVKCLAMQDGWTSYVTHFWARLMERVRLSYCEVQKNSVQLTFMETVYGTFMLACIAILSDGHDLIFGGGTAWAELFPIEATWANLLKTKALEALGYNLELSKWTLAMDNVERENCQLLGLKEATLLMSRLSIASRKLERSRENGSKLGIDRSARDLRLLRRSLAKVRLELSDEVRGWNNLLDSVSSALHPMFLYRPLEIDLARIDLLVNESKYKSRVIYLTT